MTHHFKTRSSRSKLLPLVILLLALTVAGVQAQEPLIINEVLADPASDWNGDGAVDFKGDEWVEVRNVGPDVIDMSTYWLRDDTGDEPHLQLFGLIEPGDVNNFGGQGLRLRMKRRGYTM